jgi:hypothetical protein
MKRLLIGFFTGLLFCGVRWGTTAPANRTAPQTYPSPANSQSAAPGSPDQQTSPTTPDAQQTLDESQGSTAQPNSSASSFIGTVLKAGDQYVLKTDKGTFVLDDQARAKRYDGKDVKVSGTLNEHTGVLYVTDIVPAGRSY